MTIHPLCDTVVDHALVLSCLMPFESFRLRLENPDKTYYFMFNCGIVNPIETYAVYIFVSDRLKYPLKLSCHRDVWTKKSQKIIKFLVNKAGAVGSLQRQTAKILLEFPLPKSLTNFPVTSGFSLTPALDQSMSEFIHLKIKDRYANQLLNGGQFDS